MTLAEYNALPAISASAIKRGRLSMAHMRHEMLRPRDGADGDTPALRFGRLAHAALFEPVRFAGMIAVWGGARKQGGLWDGFKAANEGKELVTRAELDRLQAMQEAARADNEARHFLSMASKFEYPITWTDPDCGQCKARIDLCGDRFLGEYKTTKGFYGTLEGQKERLFRSFESIGYWEAIGWYWHGYGRPEYVRFLVQEKEPPYCCGVFNAEAQDLEEAYNKAREIAVAYRIAERSNVFPGPFEGLTRIERRRYDADGVEVDVSTGEMEASEL